MALGHRPLSTHQDSPGIGCSPTETHTLLSCVAIWAGKLLELSQVCVLPPESGAVQLSAVIMEDQHPDFYICQTF